MYRSLEPRTWKPDYERKKSTRNIARSSATEKTQEMQKRKFWVEKLITMPESTREPIETRKTLEPSQLFRKIAERLLKEGA